MAADPEREAFAISSRYTNPAGRVVKDTCLPRMFLVHDDESLSNLDEKVILYSDDHAACGGRAVSTEPVVAPEDAAFAELPGEDDDEMPEPACRELPASAFDPEELSEDRPCTLPRGFHVRQMPKTITNYISENRNKRQCKLMWSPNQYSLKMGDGYRKLFGRYVRTTNGAWIYFNLAFLDYCIVFHTKMLNAPGVEFRPLFVPSPSSDGNFWARDATDNARIMNTIPPIPAGIYIPFGRLPGHLSVRLTRVARESVAPGSECIFTPKDSGPLGFASPSSSGPTKSVYVLQSKFEGEHPIAKGLSVFPPLEEEGTDPSYQDGGVGYIMYRMNAKEIGFQNETEQPGQPIVLYARCVFGSQALAPVEEQRHAIFRAVKFALSNAPKSSSGKAFVTLDTSHRDQDGSSFGTLQEVVPSEMEGVVLSGGINAVNVEEQAPLLVARWIRLDNPDASFEDALREARFCMLLARMPRYPLPTEPVDVCYGGYVRTFELNELERACALVDRALHLTSTWASVTAASPVLFNLAPPDVERFAEKNVVVVGFLIRVHLGAASTGTDVKQSPTDLYQMYKTVSDVGTRFMWDMMLFNGQLSVTSTRKETLLSLLTDKAPGELNVHSAKQGLPARTTKTSKCRRIKDPHPALKPFVVDTTDEALVPPPVAHAPHMDREVANDNPLLQMVIRGPYLPSVIPGSEMAIYCPGTKARSTHFAGTCHSWPVHAGFVEKCIMTPQSPEFTWGFFDKSVSEDRRKAAVDMLYAPLYNSVKGQIWSLEGYWRSEEFRRREWETAYGVSVSLMHRAMMFLMYPAFASEYKRPQTIRIWDLKQSCEAVMQFMSRWGRIIRGVLQNRRRKVRDDVQGVTRNYVAAVGRRVKDAPIANVFLSAYNAFPDNLIVGEAPRRRSDLLDPRANPGAVDSWENMFYEEVTTSHVHTDTIPFADETDLSLDFAEEDEEEQEEELEGVEGAAFSGAVGGLPSAPCTLGSVFPRSLEWSLGGAMSIRSIIGSLRPVDSLLPGPETMQLMRDIEAIEEAAGPPVV